MRNGIVNMTTVTLLGSEKQTTAWKTKTVSTCFSVSTYETRFTSVFWSHILLNTYDIDTLPVASPIPTSKKPDLFPFSWRPYRQHYQVLINDLGCGIFRKGTRLTFNPSSFPIGSSPIFKWSVTRPRRIASVVTASAVTIAIKTVKEMGIELYTSLKHRATSKCDIHLKRQHQINAWLFTTV